MRNFFQGVVVVGFLAFLGLALVATIYSEAHFRYRITVPAGRYTTSYYTDGYTQRGNCVRFREFNARDTSQVCGQFSIVRLR